jgi:hypothetical protein
VTKARVNADNVTADIAGITAGTGITGGGTSGTVTITNDMATTIAAAGDLIYGTANDAYAALSLGTAGQLLKVNSGATAPEWGAAPTAGANWSLLNAGGTSLSSSTTTISGISGKDKILILVEGAGKGDYGSIFVRLNGDTGNNYYRNGLEHYLAGSYAATNWARVNGTISYIQLSEVYSNGAATGSVMISGCNSSGVKAFQTIGYGSGTTPWYNYTLSGYYNSSSTISSISINTSAGTFNSGIVYVYASA